MTARVFFFCSELFWDSGAAENLFQAYCWIEGQHEMGRHYSNDLRERVAAAAVSGRSCKEVATLFSVSVASAVKWSQRLRQTAVRRPNRKAGGKPVLWRRTRPGFLAGLMTNDSVVS